MYYKDSLISQLAALKRREAVILLELEGLPKDYLHKKASRGKIYYYRVENKKSISLKADDPRIDSYLLREKLHVELAKVQQNIKSIEYSIKNYCPLSELEPSWDTLGSEENNYLAEYKIHKYKGVYYRSKSEVMIASMLLSYGIPFKYEAAFKLNGHTIYPDFVIKRPRDGKLFIWEHSGVMMKPGAIEKFSGRLKEYYDNGFYLWDNLIYTFDTEIESLNVDIIQRIIEVFLL